MRKRVEIDGLKLKISVAAEADTSSYDARS